MNEGEERRGATGREGRKEEEHFEIPLSQEHSCGNMSAGLRPRWSVFRCIIVAVSLFI